MSYTVFHSGLDTSRAALPQVAQRGSGSVSCGAADRPTGRSSSFGANRAYSALQGKTLPICAWAHDATKNVRGLVGSGALPQRHRPVYSLRCSHAYSALTTTKQGKHQVVVTIEVFLASSRRTPPRGTTTAFPGRSQHRDCTSARIHRVRSPGVLGMKNPRRSLRAGPDQDPAAVRPGQRVWKAE